MKTASDRILVIKALPKDIAALDKRSVLANVNSQGSGTQKPSPGHIPKLGEDNRPKVPEGPIEPRGRQNGKEF